MTERKSPNWKPERNIQRLVCPVCPVCKRIIMENETFEKHLMGCKKKEETDKTCFKGKKTSNKPSELNKHNLQSHRTGNTGTCGDTFTARYADHAKKGDLEASFDFDDEEVLVNYAELEDKTGDKNDKLHEVKGILKKTQSTLPGKRKADSVNGTAQAETYENQNHEFLGKKGVNSKFSGMENTGKKIKIKDENDKNSFMMEGKSEVSSSVEQTKEMKQLKLSYYRRAEGKMKRQKIIVYDTKGIIYENVVTSQEGKDIIATKFNLADYIGNVDGNAKDMVVEVDGQGKFTLSMNSVRATQ